MKRILILLLSVLFLAACMRRGPAPLGADAPADKVPNIVGVYALNGVDATDERYGGTLAITAAEKPNEYIFQWMISGGIHEGVGVLEGNKLTVNWHSMDTGAGENISGTASYTVTVNGELYGTRVLQGMEKPGTESAYPNPK